MIKTDAAASGKTGAKKSFFSNICYALSGTWRNERRVILLILLQILTGVCIPLTAVALPSMVVEGLSGQTAPERLLFQILSALLILLSCNVAGTYISSVYETYLLNNKIGFLSALFRKRMELNYAFIESEEGQSLYQCALSTLFNDTKGISGLLNMIGPITGDLLNLMLYTGIAVQFDYRILPVLAVTSALHLSVAVRITGKQHRLREPVNALDRKISYLLRYISDGKGGKDIKIFSMQGWLSGAIDRLIGERMEWAKKVAGYSFLLAISDVILLAIRDAFAYFCVLQAVFSGKIQIWQFVFYLGVITNVSVFVTNLTNYAAGLGQRSREISDLRAFMEKEGQRPKAELKPEASLSVRLEDVSFRFNDDGPWILKHINLAFQGNEKIALVGENGAGKTTLVKLICGLYQPTCGKVLVNGTDLNETDSSSIQRLFAAVFQDIHLLPMTVGENVAFHEAGQYPDEIKRCLKQAGLKGDLEDSGRHLTKMLHPDGIVPSGGQAQKLVLARAAFRLLYKNTKILILDEPTAALDALSEKAFYESYRQMAENRSCIFISHRLASTQFCDRILVMNQGEIVETGTHTQLMAENTRYRELYEIQSRYYQTLTHESAY